MARVRNLKQRFHDTIREWLLEKGYSEEHIIDMYGEDEEIEVLADRIITIFKHHKGEK